ncbi:MAG: FtsX-like permease family protein [Coriobacteriia bacterium]|nr:FtsX-like permease family protein [Coriobacteriia bacterium]
MKVKDLMAETFLSLTANKARSFLTILGIVVGITAVIVLVALGQGASASIKSNISSIGANLLTVSPGGSRSSMIGGGGAGSNTKSLTANDVAAIKTQVANIAAVAEASSGNYQVSAGSNNTNVAVTGTTIEYPSIRTITLQSGSWFVESQQTNAARVAVLGSTTAETLFGTGADALGKTIRIQGQPFTVIGVTQTKGTTTSTQSSGDSAVYIPFDAYKRYLSSATGVSTIYIEASSQDAMSQVQADITALLLSRHGITDSTKADFTVANQAELASTLSTVTATLTTLLAAIAGISLLVGGIGIMNMMLTTVTERIREIGLRKAIGATRSDLTSQFLAEAVALTVLGGVIGIILGWGIAAAIKQFANYSTVVSWSSVLLAVGVSTAIGIVFGYYPARRAARLDPIEALRYQ